MTPIEKLDTVLSYLANLKIPYQPLNHGNIMADMIYNNHDFAKQDYFSKELKSILNKLYDDGYVEIDKNETGKLDLSGKKGFNEYYSITFNGTYFINELDGYQGQHQQKISENIRLGKLEIFQRKQAERLNELTLLAVVGTIALVLWEILKYFLFDHHWYFHPY